MYKSLNKREYIKTDPIFFPHGLNGNIEFVSFVSAVFAYGRVTQIQKFLNNFFSIFGNKPLLSKNKDSNLYYRFQKSSDITHFVNFLDNLYEQYGSIQNLFYTLSSDLEVALSEFVIYAKEYGTKVKAGRGYFFLFPDIKASGAKRLRMFLRWMVRSDEVDFGIWSRYSKSELKYPTDTHILNFAKRMYIIKNSNNNYTNLNIITEYFKKLNPLDPVKYDFSITRLGILYKCQFMLSDNCSKCIFMDLCSLC